MVTSLHFMAFTLAAAGYLKLGFDHGGWYWPLVGYALLELVALSIKCRCGANTTAQNANDTEIAPRSKSE